MASKPPTSTEQGEAPDLAPELAALIDSIDSRLEQLDLFTLLEVDLNADRAVLQRAYFKRSMVFHPDRYFNRKIGPYKKKLERIFAYMNAAYEFLKEDRRRAAYRKKILNARGDNQATLGGRIMAVQTPKGLTFVITDEASFYGPDDDAARGEPEGEASAGQPDGRQVALPQKQYALPRLRRPAAAKAAAPEEPEAHAKPSLAPDVEAMLRDFLRDEK